MGITGQQGREMSDATLVARMAAGDERALGLLYDRHGQVAYGLALAITKRETVAEQVVADSFSEVWRSAKSYCTAERSVSGAVLSVVRRQALTARGRQGRVATNEQSIDRHVVIERSTGAHAVRLPGNERTRDAVIGVLTALPESERRVLELAYFSGLPIREIALETHESEEQVTSQLRSAMDALKRSLSKVAAHPPESTITRA
jgi:RNA polymerase sigma-70 factor (ECF subfamily)